MPGDSSLASGVREQVTAKFPAAELRRYRPQGESQPMRWNVLNRKTHYWTSAVIAIPTLIMICSGILLQVKKQWTWVQPAEQRGTGTAPQIDLEAILTSVRSVPGYGSVGWDQVQRIDMRPGRGLAKVSLHDGWEVQVDLGTGAVLQHAVRRSDVIESIHDGSFFAGDLIKLGVFLPTGLTLAVLWLTGLWMFWLPFSVRRKRRLTAALPLPSD